MAALQTDDQQRSAAALSFSAYRALLGERRQAVTLNTAARRTRADAGMHTYMPLQAAEAARDCLASMPATWARSEWAAQHRRLAGVEDSGGPVAAHRGTSC